MTRRFAFAASAGIVSALQTPSVLAVLSVSLWFTFSAIQFSGSPNGDGMGTPMDSTALQELIAQIRGASTAVVEAEQKVTAAKTELAQQKRGAQVESRSALLRDAVKPTPNRPRSGWLPAG